MCIEQNFKVLASRDFENIIFLVPQSADRSVINHERRLQSSNKNHCSKFKRNLFGVLMLTKFTIDNFRTLSWKVWETLRSCKQKKLASNQALTTNYQAKSVRIWWKKETLVNYLRCGFWVCLQIEIFSCKSMKSNTTASWELKFWGTLSNTTAS